MPAVNCVQETAITYTNRSIHIYLEKTGRKPAVPPAPLIVGIVWFLIVVTGIVISHRFNLPLEFCMFRRLTGIPCPTCGSTTGGMLILQGHLLQGWLQNPFVYSALPLIGVHLLFQGITCYSTGYRFTGRALPVPVAGLTILILLNWAYLVLKEL